MKIPVFIETIAEFFKSSPYNFSSEFQEEFKAELNRINIKAARIILLVGAICIPIFFLTGIDFLFSPDSYLMFLFLRIGASIICLIMYFFSCQKKYEKYAQHFSLACLITAGWVIAIMIRKIGYDSPYYAGLNLVYLCSMLVPWGMERTLFACLSIYSFYLIPIFIYDLPNLDLKIFLTNNQFQIFTILVAAVVSRFQHKTRTEEILNRLTIAKQAKELEDREKQKNRLLSNITHELKTPLSIIIGNSDLVLESLPPEMKNSMENPLVHVQQAAFQMANHVDRIITVSVADDPDKQLNLDVYNYIGIVKNVMSLFEKQSETSKISLVLDAPKMTNLVVRVDVSKIEEILRNLIQNAFKFSNPGGVIIVHVTADNTNIHTEVSDTGCGIAEDKISRIFERMFQADDVLSKRHGGIGVGLYLVQKNIKLHGGEISVTSTVGKGTTFHFTLPLHIDQTVAVKNQPYTGPERRSGDRRNTPDRRITERIKRYEYEQNLTAECYANLKSFANIMEHENKKPAQPSILILEDNQAMMGVSVDALKNDYNLFLARDGYEGLEKLKTHHESISLILTDVMMPGMSGYDFCKTIMEEEKYKHIPLIFISALMSEEDQLKGFSLGATDYIVKPYNVRILKEKVSYWISRRTYEQILQDFSASLEDKVQETEKLKEIVLHEIRNPLQVISGTQYFFSKLYELHYEKSDEKEKTWWDSVKKIENGLQSLKSVSELSKTLKELHQTHKVPETVKSIIDYTLVQTSHFIREVDFKLEADPQIEGLRIRCDKPVLAQVFVNIIRNAVEAMMEKKVEKPSVRFRFHRPSDEKIKIEIHNNGPEIAPEILQNLFKFKYTTKKDGTGIGLHFSKIIIKIHDGNINVSSGRDTGTTFTIVLPVE